MTGERATINRSFFIFQKVYFQKPFSRNPVAQVQVCATVVMEPHITASTPLRLQRG
jgi:hypothetical protein